MLFICFFEWTSSSINLPNVPLHFTQNKRQFAVFWSETEGVHVHKSNSVIIFSGRISPPGTWNVKRSYFLMNLKVCVTPTSLSLLLRACMVQGHVTIAFQQSKPFPCFLHHHPVTLTERTQYHYVTTGTVMSDSHNTKWNLRTVRLSSSD